MNGQETALYDWHVEQGAKIVDFHGWRLPVQYSGLLDEHRAVREAAGLFDVSHMGEIEVVGPGALAQVNNLVSNDCSNLRPGQILYTVACREDGGILDDLLVYRLEEDRFMLVVNASNVAKLSAWTRERIVGPRVNDLSADISQIAIQGPASTAVMGGCHLLKGLGEKIEELPFYEFFRTTLEGEDLIVSRTGYTGERGYEIYLPNRLAPAMAAALMEAGADLGIKPAGLGCRDTLRFEASYCLYGNELDEDTDPYEASLFWLVKMKKGDFIGRKALLERKDRPEARRLVGLSFEGRRIARQGFPVFCDNEEVGSVTSGTFAPTLQKSLAIAKIKRTALKGDLSVEIRGVRYPALTVKLPFYNQPELRA